MMRFLLFYCLLSGMAFAATINIPADYSFIQLGIDAGSNGDVVLAAPGTYHETINFKGKALSVKSSGGAGVTTIDGNQTGSVVTFDSGEGANSVLTGFTLTNGYASATPGGGINCVASSPMITKNIILGNSSTQRGGGISCCDYSSPIISNNTISGNTSWNSGGGINCNNYSSPSILDNAIIGNTSNLAPFPDTFGGGGISCIAFSSPSIINNTITGNKCSFFDGGGICCITDASPTIAGNTISGNEAPNGQGGGIFSYSLITITNNKVMDNLGIGIFCQASAPIITNNLIKGNQGHGIACRFASPEITHNVIQGNHGEIFEHGGGICCLEGAAPFISNNIIEDNSAKKSGGGIACFKDCSPLILNNAILNNSSNNSGGGVYCYDNSSPTFINNIFSGNSSLSFGGGLFCEVKCSPVLTNNTLTGNMAVSGGAFSSNGQCKPVFTNSIFWDNSAGSGPEMYLIYDTQLSMAHSDVKGGKASIHVGFACTLNWGAGMIDGDPCFVDPLNGDFHLTYPSPCRDSGDNSVVTQMEDFENDPRIANGAVDMGADEFHTHLYCTGDKVIGGTVDIKFIGAPSASPVVLWLGSGVLNPPMSLPPYGDWHLQFPVLFGVNFGAIPSNGNLWFSSPVPLGLPLPLDLPLQAGIGNQLTNLCVLEIR